MHNTQLPDQPHLLKGHYMGILLNALLFITNFFLFYFIWLRAFPDTTGLTRLIFCWTGAYTMTWVMAILAKGTARLILLAIFLSALYTVFRYHP